jgi:MFS family permease
MIDLGPLGRILGIRVLRPMLLGSLAGRLPLGMASVALLVGVQANTGSITTAGLVGAAGTAGCAIGAPIQGRMLDRLDRKRVLSVFALVQGLSLALLAAGLRARLDPALLTALALVFGLSIPSLSAATRWVLRTVVEESQVSAAFALEASTIEFVFIVGPALAAGTAVALGPEPVLLACAVMVWAGTAVFIKFCDNAWLAHDTAQSATDKAAGGDRRVLVVGMFALGMAFLASVQGFLPLAITQLTVERHSDLTPVGIALSVLSIGSLAGGLVYGSVRWRLGIGARFVILALGYGAPLVVLMSLPSYPVLYVVVGLAGLFLAPTVSLCLHILDQLSKSGAWMQTQSWGVVANTAGTAAGSALGGVVVAKYGAGGGFLSAVVVVLICIAIAVPAIVALRRSAPAEADAEADADAPDLQPADQAGSS